MNIYKAKWFTLLEIVIVIIIVWILLLVTLNLGFNYVKTTQVKTDKELFVGWYNKVMAIARTSNFYWGEEYESINVWFTMWWISAVTDVFETIGTYDLTKSMLEFSWALPAITVEPYSIWCSISVGTGVDFTLVSTINNDEYCFSISDSTCKLLQVQCD